MDFLAQYNALTQSAGFALLRGRTILSVTGSDRIQFLQSFTTNDIKKLTLGHGCEAFVTNTQGKTLGHVLIFCEADQLLLDTTPDQQTPLIEHFNHYVITEDVVFTDRTTERCEILLAGPNAADLLKNVASDEPPRELLTHRAMALAGQQVHVYRVEFAGPLAFFVQSSATAAEAIAEALGGAGAICCEEPAVESTRLEAGVPCFGADITAENLPQEVARDRQAISFTKGCYLGQETVARIDAIGHVNRLLVGLKFSGSEIPAGGTAVLAETQIVGQVTSAAWSPRLNSPLALGYVRRSFAKPGTKLSSASGAVEVVDLPLPG